jgi:hypothetical protein
MLRWKFSEMKKNGGKTSQVAASYGENCTLLALFIFSAKMLKYVRFFSDALHYRF